MAAVSMVPSNTNKLQIGDYVLKAGNYTKPGVVVEKKEDGSVVIDTDQEMISLYHRHTNTSGLSPEEKEHFNTIMDDIMASENSSEKINQLQAAIDTLKEDPINKKVVETLRNQQAELIRSSRELPRIYSFDGAKIR